MDYFIFRNSDSAAPGIHLQSGAHIATGETSFKSYFGAVTSLESDLLLVAASIFAADRGTPRGEREDFARQISISIPVVNIGVIQSVRVEIEEVLRLLSNDHWHVTFRQDPGALDNTPAVSSEGSTLLFSGGLDSLAAALDYASEKNLVLVSHVTHGSQARNAQVDLVSMLGQAGIALPHYQFFVSSRDQASFDHDVESSQRTRSFMFLVLAGLVARRLGHRRIVMIAENGQLAIHLPLNPARVGAFSTHTAHPDVLMVMQKILGRLFGYDVTIENPFSKKTKAEVVKMVWDGLKSAIPVANSCWKSARLAAGITHCGECIPCLIRRVAIETHGSDPTAYGVDAFGADFASLPPDSEARRNLADLCEFITCFGSMSDAELYDEWPELYSENIPAPEIIGMYRRASAETRAVMQKYPGLVAVLT